MNRTTRCEEIIATWFVMGLLQLLEELFEIARRCDECGRFEERWTQGGEGCDCIPF